MKRLILSIGLLFSFGLMAESVSAQQASASLEFIPSATSANSGQEFTVDVVLKNPGLQNIISVRTWMEYNPELLEAVSINTDNLPFTLAAPGENEFSAEEGLIKIGRSNISGGYKDQQTKVATVKFKVKGTSVTQVQLKPYDYQTSELGHTSVNIIDQGFPVNILTTAPNTVSIALNGSPAPEVGGEQETSNLGSASLSRPANLKINTGSGYVDLKWDKSLEQGISGYNIYYGKTSGEYTRRRTVENVQQYRLEGLNNGEAYYFAITAFDAQNKESDYSDEVAIIVNEPLSSTSPFEPFNTADLSKVPVTPQNGPLVGWLGLSALGLGGVLVFRKKSLNSRFSNDQ